MKVFGLSLVILAMTSLPAMAAPGDQWILGIHQLNQGTGPINENVGAGYSGFHSSGNSSYFGNSYQHSGTAGDITRFYWELSGPAVNSGRSVPSTTELYTIEYWGVAQENGRNDFQPIESQFHGIVGEGNHGIPPWQSTPSPFYDEHIPWIGAFQSNHQFIRAPRKPLGGQDQAIVPGDWNATGDGTHTPESADYFAEEFGIYMWLTSGSWLYAKWDFPFATNRTWSAVRLTQITGPAPLAGDYNEDGNVDAADYVIWRKTNIGGSDGYDVWVANFGRSLEGAGAGSTNGGGSGVPEPESAALLITGLVGLAWFAARRRFKTIYSVV